MAISYKRTIIQVPLKDIDKFEEYADTYGLSFSSAIICLAKKGLEQESIIENVPQIMAMYWDYQNNMSKTNKKVPKNQKK